MTRLTLVSLVIVMAFPFGVVGQDSISGLEMRARELEPAPGDSFELMAMSALMRGAEDGDFGLTDEQAREMARLSSQLSQWKQEQVEEVSKEYGGWEKAFSDRALAKQIIANAETNVLETWLKSMQEQVLLPVQYEQLKASCIANVRKLLGDHETFATPWVRKELEIDDEQLERINKRIDEETARLEAEAKRSVASLEEARAEAISKILSELTPSQREKAIGLFPGFQPEEIAK